MQCTVLVIASIYFLSYTLFVTALMLIIEDVDMQNIHLPTSSDSPNRVYLSTRLLVCWCPCLMIYSTICRDLYVRLHVYCTVMCRTWNVRASFYAKAYFSFVEFMLAFN